MYVCMCIYIYVVCIHIYIDDIEIIPYLRLDGVSIPLYCGVRLAQHELNPMFSLFFVKRAGDIPTVVGFSY